VAQRLQPAKAHLAGNFLGTAMRIIHIPKRNGEYRKIYIPDAETKHSLRLLLGNIEKKSRSDVVHGFTKSKSPVTNALAHVGHNFTLTFDLKDFFDSVKPEHLAGKLKKEELELVFVDGAPRQGLPTSPAVANLAAAQMDQNILRWIEKNNYNIIYTRYADDLAFSYDDPALSEPLKKQIPIIISKLGFKVNRAKTKLQSAKVGRRVITGVAVDDTIHPTRAAKRRLRAARHQRNRNQSQGLAEWCKLVLPRERSQKVSGEDIEKLGKIWKLGRLPREFPFKEEEQLGNDVLITGDPIYMFGMSDWTTGWRSCMTHGNSPTSYHRGVIFWALLRGTRLAALLDTKTKVVAGVERRVMRARALVHSLRNGVKVYDKFYGCPDAVEILKRELVSAGYIPVSKGPRGIAVVGHVCNKIRPYFDNLRSHTATAKEGIWKGKKVTVAEI
jgi:hypothetical protein